MFVSIYFVPYQNSLYVIHLFHLLLSLNTFANYYYFLTARTHQETLTISQFMITVIPGKNFMEAIEVTKLFSLTSEFCKNMSYVDTTCIFYIFKKNEAEREKGVLRFDIFFHESYSVIRV